MLIRSSLHALTTPALALALPVAVAAAPAAAAVLGAPEASAAAATRPAIASHAPAWTPRTPDRRRAVPSRAPFTVATFNMLGASHTGRGGNKPHWAGGATRARWAVRLLERHGVDVVGFQEMQAVQARTFRARAGGRYRLYSAPGDTDNSIAWDRSVFSLVSATTERIPYFGGHVRHMPVVLLRENRTGQDVYFVNVHNPADTRQHPHNAHWRAVATRRELALVKALRSHGDPVFVTGDMNDRRRAFCRFTASGDLHAAAGGSHAGGCRAPGYHGIDWIFGSAGTRFSRFTVDRSALVRRTTDHPVVIAHVG